MNYSFNNPLKQNLAIEHLCQNSELILTGCQWQNMVLPKVGYAFFYQDKLVANQQLGACLLMMQRRECSEHMTDISQAERQQKDRDGG